MDMVDEFYSTDLFKYFLKKGFDIHIPTIMISKADGDMLAKFMPNQTVSISFEFVLVNYLNHIFLKKKKI